MRFVAAAMIVSAFFYGREAGQREHDLKNAGAAGPVMAWLGSLLMFRWSLDNLFQWLSPTLAVVLAVIGYGLWHMAHVPSF